MTKKPEERPPAYVEVRQIEIPKPKPKPPRNAARSKPAPRPRESARKPAEKPAAPSVPAFDPSGSDIPLVLPDISIPKSFTETKQEIAMPDVIGTPERKNPETPKGPSVDKELASLEAGREERGEKEGALEKEIKSAGKASVSGQIYNFDVAPTNNRSVRDVPPEPEFALENDAKVTLKFSIDKEGNTSDITFVTRSTKRVEQMAYDYVSRMRFDAVLHDDKDNAQVTITFSVRK